MTDTRYRTANGVEITHGLRVWDYNLNRAVVKITGTSADPDSAWHGTWDGWFDMITPDGRHSSIMNGERMTTRHPFTGEAA